MSQRTERFHSLDALRASALLLGIFFHAAESFCPGRFSWAIVDPQAHWLFAFSQHLLHSFRMEVFYLIAGFFAHLVIRQRGIRTFVANRVQRIAVPFVAGWLVLYPLMILIWTWGRQSMGRLDLLGIPPGANAPGAVHLTVQFFRSGQFLGDGFSLVHLWFLYYLMLLYTFTLLVRLLWRRLAGSERPLQFLDSLVSRSLSSGWSIPLAAIPTAILLFLMGGGVRTPNRSLLPDVPVLCVYGLFFGLGWMIHRQTDLLGALRARWALNLGIGLSLAPITFFGRELAALLEFPISGSSSRMVHAVLYAVMMWSLSFGFCGLIMTACKKESRFWRYLADSSYWLYLSHLPVVVPLQIVVSRLDWAVPLKYLTILLAAFPLLFLSYHFLVRNTLVGEQLNGRRFPPKQPVRRHPRGFPGSPVRDGSTLAQADRL